MEDTTPEVKKIFRELLMSRSEEERMIMCAEMFDSAREVIIASLPKDLSEKELKRQIFERTYGYPLPDDFNVSEKW